MGRPISREQRETELGLEIQCAQCKEFWPCDPEFFYFSHGAPHSWCKACYRGNERVLAKVDRWKEKQRARTRRAAHRPGAVGLRAAAAGRRRVSAMSRYESPSIAQRGQLARLRAAVHEQKPEQGERQGTMRCICGATFHFNIQSTGLSRGQCSAACGARWVQ